MPSEHNLPSHASDSPATEQRIRALSDQWSHASAHSLLPTALSAAVPLWIAELVQRGGPTLADWQRLAEVGRLLAAHGDALLFSSPREGETAQVFNALAEGLALLAFLPGGVSFAGQHFDALPLLTSLLGPERAASYLTQVRQARRLWCCFRCLVEQAAFVATCSVRCERNP